LAGLPCPADGQEVHPEHRVKGFEIAPDQYVIVRDEEIEAAKPAKSRSITIEHFVKPEQIDPRHFERPYYLLPGENAARNYRLLWRAMGDRGVAGVARFVMRDKEYLAAIRPVGEVLGLYTMRFGEELVDPASGEFGDVAMAKPVTVSDRELKMAMQLVESLQSDFRPGDYRNDYVRKVRELIEAKARGEEVATEPAYDPKPTAGRSLADVLAASLAQAKRDKGSPEPPVDTPPPGKTRGKAKVETHHRTRPTTKKK
jgi:DNA end-binding protein Ku